MDRKSNGRRAAALVLAAAMTASSMPLGAARAELVTTDRVIEGSAAQDRRARVSAFLAREEVRQQLTEMGIDADEASKRVGGMSDAELAQVADRMDAMPAGQQVGSGTLVLVLLLVVLILLVV